MRIAFDADSVCREIEFGDPGAVRQRARDIVQDRHERRRASLLFEERELRGGAVDAVPETLDLRGAHAFARDLIGRSSATAAPRR